MRLLVELLLSLVLFSPFGDAWLYYRVKGDFSCYGEPADVKIRIVEHDPLTDDVIEFAVNSTFDYTGADQDFLIYPYDNLELSIHATFKCHRCKDELYQYIDRYFQFEEKDQAEANPMIFGSISLEEVCKSGNPIPRFSSHDRDKLKRLWRRRNKETNIRGHFNEIN